MSAPDNEKIAEILNNGLIGIEDRLDALEGIRVQLESLNESLGDIQNSMNTIANYFASKYVEEGRL